MSTCLLQVDIVHNLVEYLIIFVFLCFFSSDLQNGDYGCALYFSLFPSNAIQFSLVSIHVFVIN